MAIQWQCHKGNVDYGTPWELEDESGTVGKLSASCFEVSGSRSKSQGFPKSYVSRRALKATLRLCRPSLDHQSALSQSLSLLSQSLSL